MRLYNADLIVSMGDDDNLVLRLEVEVEDGIPPELAMRTLPGLMKKVAQQVEDNPEIVKVTER